MDNKYTAVNDNAAARAAARRAINLQMATLGISRKELAARLEITVGYLSRIICGTGSNSVQARKLIEIALGIPIWSAPEVFNSLTQFLSRNQFPKTTQTEKTKK
jgi:transcriptional regulator with XRE-family HTH domain